MTNARKVALETLRSRNFFDILRGSLRRMGLAGEERFGIGLFFVWISRFRPNPLRVYIQEATPGSATYLVRRVAKLLPSNQRVGIFRDLDQAWPHFEKYPKHKVVYLPPKRESGSWKSELQLDFLENRLTATWPVDRGGRVVERKRTVEDGFVLVSAEPPPYWKNLTRWLTLRLPSPREGLSDAESVDKKELAEWLEVQELIEERSQVPVFLPEWEELVIEKICQDERSRRHVPAFLIAWKTMCMLRSFLADGKEAEHDVIEGDFESLAATAALLKKVFREGCWFPSTAQIYDTVTKPASRTGLVNPVTGKALTYFHREDRKPVRYHSLLE
jgi:hypothetical protein